jgi:type III pantothenate kinase
LQAHPLLERALVEHGAFRHPLLCPAFFANELVNCRHGYPIAVDIGNSTIKLGWFDDDPAAAWPTARQTWSISTLNSSTLQVLEGLPVTRADWLVASVHRGAEQQLAKGVERNRPRDRYRKLVNAELPIRSLVEQPDRVGTDRLLAAIGANHLRHPDHPAIVIDAGSAVTVDLVDASGAFRGGVIWPGRAMMTDALAGNTDALPLITSPLEECPPPVVGTSTEKAMRAGLFWGNVGAVREFVARMRVDDAANADVFVTGGDAERLARFACPEARRVPDLVLAGIILSARASKP